MRSSRWLFVLMIAVMPFAGCGDNRNEACEPCSNVDDCEAGLTCQQFVDTQTGTTRLLCGDANPDMRCPGR